MGKKKKLIRFKANEQLERLMQPSALDLLAADHELKGRWNTDYFGVNSDIIVEVGCGRGEYTVGLAKLCPDCCFVGIDVKGSRLYFGATEIQKQNLKNALFIRTQVEMLPKIFGREISEIWVTFPDPFPDRPRRRLTSPLFLNRYIHVLKPGGKINLKTDNYELFDFTKQVVEENGYELTLCTDDLYHSDLLHKVPEIQTAYEKRFLAEGKKICYLQFVLDKEAKPLKKKTDQK